MDREGDQIVDSILRLASSLGIDVVAEGIETKEQWGRLARMGCRYGQGYLFARPLPSANAGKMVREMYPWGRPDWMEMGRDLCELHLGVSGSPKRESKNGESGVTGGVLGESASPQNG